MDIGEKWKGGRLMFQKGEYIVYGQHGICLVEDITHLNMSEADEKKLYYVLVPVGTRGSRIYYPADRENRNARYLMTKEEALSLLEEFPALEKIQVGIEKLREDTYKKALYSGNQKIWASLLKTLYERKQDRLKTGKRIASVDERYQKMVEEALCGELAFVLGKTKQELKQVLTSQIPCAIV